MVGGSERGRQHRERAGPGDEPSRSATGGRRSAHFEHGDVAWSVDRPVLHLRSGAEVPMRVTLIAVVEEGTLRLKHFHYSVGAVNEEVFRQELTTEEPGSQG